METDKHIIAPDDVYEYKCDNNQGYGYMIPVKTSVGWDFIDTYHLDRPWAENGETVADLIDRPTCFDRESQDSESFTCSFCGFCDSIVFFNQLTSSLDHVKPWYHYCPNCGMEIKE